MMEAARTSETLVNFYQTTRRYNPEDSHLHEPLGFFTLGTHWTEGWVASRASVDEVVKRKYTAPAGNETSNFRSKDSHFT
jgi:hypothetical protein